jgi:hypothetical protein
MSQPLLSSTTSFNLQELQTALEPLVRQIVREELERVMKTYSPAVGVTPTFYLAEEMPLHADLTEILARQAQGEVQLFSHQEVWDE